MTALPPVSRLPPELLVRVFEYLVTCSSPTILLQICHRWADLASSISSLWSRIDFSTPPGPFLRHRINQPIEVILSVLSVAPTSTLLAVKEVLRHHGDHIRELLLCLPSNQLQEIEPDLSRTFPILMDVPISVNRSNYSTFLYIDFLGWLPVTIRVSPIRYLRLSSVETPWIPGYFQDLVEFFLHDQSYAYCNPSMEIFLEILKSSPRLTLLSVANAGPEAPRTATTLPPAIVIVHLHNLHHLYLEQEDPCDVRWMIIHLVIPASANVKIFINPEHKFFPIWPVIDLVLPSHPGFPHFTNLRRCTYAIDGWSRWVIIAANLILGIARSGSIPHFDKFMMPFLHRATTAGVIEDLTVILGRPTRRSPPSAAKWDQILCTLPSLQKLEIQQSSSEVDLSILAFFESSPSPTLRDLWLSFPMSGNEPPEEREGEKGELVERLVKYCAERDQSGYRLERLVIGASMHPPPDLASSLTPYVDHLEIRNEDLHFEDIGKVEFGSRRAFDFRETCYR